MKEKEDKRKKARKKLEEMNLLDDFLFGSVITYPEIGEKFARSLLKIIFGREFKYLSVTAQKVFYGEDSDLHGARLDVYMEPEIEEYLGERAIVYDMEPDKNDSESDVKALPRRMRFYHAKIAVRNLSSGADFDRLKNVVIIMIMPYDPFGQNRMVYTVKNVCVEVPEMEYDDGASTLFLYTKGEEGEPAEALRQLLHYMENTTYDNAVNEELREIHGMVEAVRKDSEVSAKYMIRYLRMMEELNRTRAEGRAEGEAAGRAEGEAAGRMAEKVFQVCKKMKRNQSLEKIAEDMVEQVSAIEPIYNIAREFAPEYNPDLVLERWKAVDNKDNR
ncbi:hypothetical protein AALA90_16400 [Lachnospiraceae bacterium 38-10]